MISASCPSCAAPLVFAHAASLTAVCGACDSTVVRDDITLRDLGKLAPADAARTTGLSWFYSNGTREPIKPDPDGASGGDDDA